MSNQGIYCLETKENNIPFIAHITHNSERTLLQVAVLLLVKSDKH